MFKLLLISLVVSSAFAKLGIDAFPYAKSLNNTLIECFIQQGYEFVNLDIGSYIVDVTKNFTADYELLTNLNITHIDVSTTICGGQTADDLVHNVATALPLGFEGTIWLTLFEGLFGSCLNMPQSSASIQFLESIAINLESDGYKVGISTDYISWQYFVLGNDVTHSSYLTGLPLFYRTGDGQPNFNDYTSSTQVGDWVVPTQKILQADDTICGSLESSIYLPN